jgi:hypothetical protein
VNVWEPTGVTAFSGQKTGPTTDRGSASTARRENKAAPTAHLDGVRDRSPGAVTWLGCNARDPTVYNRAALLREIAHSSARLPLGDCATPQHPGQGCKSAGTRTAERRLPATEQQHSECYVSAARTAQRGATRTWDPGTKVGLAQPGCRGRARR